MSRVLLVNPPRYHGIPVIRESRCENVDRDAVQVPTSLVYLAGILRHRGHEAKVLDMNGYDLGWPWLEKVLSSYGPEWTVFRSTVSTFEEDVKAAAYARRAKSRSALLNWNLHAVGPEEVKRRAPDLDYFLPYYYYETAVPKLVEGKEPPFSEEPAADIPAPPWSEIPDFRAYYTRTKAVSPWAVVIGSRGCGWACSFCIDQNQRAYRRRPELIGEELEELVKRRGVKYVSFFDDTFESEERWSTGVLDEIERRGLRLKWFINSRSDMIVRRGQAWFDRAAKLGLDGSSIGIEFGADEILARSRKSSTVATNTEAVRILTRANVKSYCSLMVGYLGETKEQMMATARWVVAAKPTGFQINTVSPLFGTTLWNEAEGLGLIDKRTIDWRGVSCVPTEVMDWKFTRYSPEEIRAIRREMYRKIYFSSWSVSNFLRWMPREPRMTLGYGLSLIGKMRHGFVNAH